MVRFLSYIGEIISISNHDANHDPECELDHKSESYYSLLVYYCAFWISKLDSWPTLLRVYLTLSTKKSKEVWYFVCLYQSINWLLVKTTKVTLFERNVPLDLFVFIRLTFFFFFFIFVFMQHSTFNEQTTLNLKRAYLFRYNLDRNLSIASVLIN